MKDLCIPETYSANGEEKTTWNKIGVLFEGKNGKTYVKLNHIPGVLIHVYEQKEKTKKSQGNNELEPDQEIPF